MSGECPGRACTSGRNLSYTCAVPGKDSVQDWWCWVRTQSSKHSEKADFLCRSVPFSVDMSFLTFCCFFSLLVRFLPFPLIWNWSRYIPPTCYWEKEYRPAALVLNVFLLFSTGTCECTPGKRGDKCKCADCKCCKSTCGSTFILIAVIIITSHYSDNIT